MEIVEQARIKRTEPRVSRQKGQISRDLPTVLTRVLPQWRNPDWYNATAWRAAVSHQPVAVDCRETIISNYLALEWKIDAKDSTQRDELKDEINYYTDFFKHTGDYAYSELIEWIGKDLLDLPFGGCAEVGRDGNRPEGRTVWIEPLDAGTLFPTLNKDWPIGQAIKEQAFKPVYFPWYAINRVYYSPRTNIWRKGWGLAPPEKVYLAMILLSRGDMYYANLLLDTPEAGILDLGDMEKASAVEWLDSFKEMMFGIDGFKIPVLYEHDKPVKWIPFGRPPTELLFDRTITKYSAITAAGYGISLSDIGLQAASSGGETLAGSIRQERRSRKTGFSRFNTKMVQFFNFMLPDTLNYRVVDQDDELSVALGRARLSNATFWEIMIDKGIFTAEEARVQTIADGLISVSFPEKPPPDAIPIEERETNRQVGMQGKPVPVSQGGHGEVMAKSDILSDELLRISSASELELNRLIRACAELISSLAREAIGETGGADASLDLWNWDQDRYLAGEIGEDHITELAVSFIAGARSSISRSMDSGRKWWELSSSNDEIVDEFADLFSTSFDLYWQRKNEIEYEKGEVDSLSIDKYVDIGDKHLEQFRSKLSDHIDVIRDKTPKFIQNCIIAGTRKALLSNPFANNIGGLLDIDNIINDNTIIRYVRSELNLMCSGIIRDTGNKITEIIQEILKENNNDDN